MGRGGLKTLQHYWPGKEDGVGSPRRCPATSAPRPKQAETLDGMHRSRVDVSRGSPTSRRKDRGFAGVSHVRGGGTWVTTHLSQVSHPGDPHPCAPHISGTSALKDRGFAGVSRAGDQPRARTTRGPLPDDKRPENFRNRILGVRVLL